MSQCIACARFNLRTAERMAPLGFGHCAAIKSLSVYRSATHERACKQFAQIDPMTENERRQWLAAKALK